MYKKTLWARTDSAAWFHGNQMKCLTRYWLESHVERHGCEFRRCCGADVSRESVIYTTEDPMSFLSPLFCQHPLKCDSGFGWFEQHSFEWLFFLLSCLFIYLCVCLMWSDFIAVCSSCCIVQCIIPNAHSVGWLFRTSLKTMCWTTYFFLIFFLIYLVGFRNNNTKNGISVKDVVFSHFWVIKWQN